MLRWENKRRESAKRYQESRRTKEPTKAAKRMKDGMNKRRKMDQRCLVTGSNNFVVCHLLGRRTRYTKYVPWDPLNMFCLNASLHTGKGGYDENTSVDARLEWLRDRNLHEQAERLIYLTTPDEFLANCQGGEKAE
ncbi:hypothetical protein [Leptospira adleri]|uniref:HNH endonuclease n=1 Tax=Leptospira adleri TaxID=2023186 RepID=A0A2M9YJ85_9LEPT|nr:hypothetical protein [Leptospira adleri]PJZ51605.1 hypothetical protein CH380_19355 [Leptospira adleri]PJZ61886.1 hypothetical protein CH376_10810 [Leptospira adleri]